MENSKIAWCHHTVNLWWGCYEVNKACDNCYAKTLANRYHGPHILWQQQGPRMFIKSAMNDILKYQARAAKENTVYRIFINSMSDLFEKPMPVVDFNHQPISFNEWFGGKEPALLEDTELETGHIRMRFFYLVEKCPNLFFILLTKRPSNIVKYVPQSWLDKPPRNIIYMTSCPDQESLDILLPQLLEVPGKHGLSLEPLIGPVDIVLALRRKVKMFSPHHALNFCNNIHWVIVGGESGFDARPIQFKWINGVMEQCKTANVPYFLKQDSQANTKDFKTIDHFPVDMQVRQFPAYEYDRSNV